MDAFEHDIPKTEAEWVLPARIPFADLKSDDLEQCLYWLLDSMGARDLDWRKGGAGAGTADGGRDLEATFYETSEEGEPLAKAWWIECKGRAGTVERQAVKDAAVNALARADLDVLVVATNTNFTNPTRDWVREFQISHPRPRILLWDQVTLERLISRQPSVVLRLFGGALSLDGRLRAAEERFWNRLEFVPVGTLEALWQERDKLDIQSMAAFSLIANEFSGGSITARPWGGYLAGPMRLEALQMGLANAAYLVARSHRAGVPTQPFVRALGYLILVVLDKYDPADVTKIVMTLTGASDGKAFPKEVAEYLLLPVLDQLQSEIQDVCSSDCSRISADRRNPKSAEGDDIESYWGRLGCRGTKTSEDPKSLLRLENLKEPCRVGFAVNYTISCPLFEIEPSLDTVGDLLATLERVATVRARGIARQEVSITSV